MKFSILIGFICFVGVYGQDAKYCQPALCTDWAGRVKPHIACPGVAQKNCPSDARQISLDGSLKQMILDKHNSYRNTIAGQQLPGFPGAIQMPVLQWDDELAYIAAQNAMTCTFAHDQCRNTANFKWAGQNLAWSQGYATDAEAIQIGVDGWWGEYKDATANDIASVGSSPKMIGHFTAMAQDRTARIGCAASVYNKDERLLTCNYSFTNLSGSPVYKSGTPASGCTTGTDGTYTNLCSSSEPVNPNP